MFPDFLENRGVDPKSFLLNISSTNDIDIMGHRNFFGNIRQKELVFLTGSGGEQYAFTIFGGWYVFNPKQGSFLDKHIGDLWLGKNTRIYPTTDDELRINAPELKVAGSGSQYNQTGLKESDDNKDDKYTVTEWGTLATYDNDGKQTLSIEYPDEQVLGNAFVAPVGAIVIGGGGESSAFTLNPISTGAAKLSSEVAGQEKTQNLIVVGGPGANSAAAALMSKTYPSYGADSGIPENKAIVKLYENGENVALLVAGWNAADTRRATSVVAKYGEYSDELVGSEVVVSGTSMTDISVSAPSLS